ncbi:MAG: PD-(D/E)XK nuclease family protein [Oligoflexales bacterium]
MLKFQKSYFSAMYQAEYIVFLGNHNKVAFTPTTSDEHDMDSQSQNFMCPPGENPLTILAEQLLKEEELHDIVVVLPTARLGHALLDLLTQKRPALRPPLLSTLDQWLWSLAKEPLHPIDAQVEELLLTALLRHENYKHLLPQHAHELRQLFHDLSINNKEDCLSEIHKLFDEDLYHDPRYLNILASRLNEIEDLQKKFKKILINKHAITTAEAMKTATRDAIQNPVTGIRKIFIAALTTVNQAIFPLLKHLSKDTRTTIFFPYTPEKKTGRNPVRELHEKLGQSSFLKTSQNNQINQKTIVRSKDPYHEVAFALHTAKKHIQEGCPPHQIGLIVANEKGYSKIFHTLLRQDEFKDIPINNSLPTPFQQTGFGSWVLEVGKLLTSKQKWLHLSDLMVHPWRPHAVPLKEDPTFLKAQLNSLQLDGDRYGFTKFFEKLPPELQVCYEELHHYVKPLFDLKGVQSISQWTEFFIEFFSPEKHHDISALDQSSTDAFQKFLQRFGEASYFHDASIPVGAFWHSVMRNLQQLEARESGFSLEGLQILGVPEARCIPFHTVIVIGCVEGSFPRSVPNDDLVDDWLKTKIGVEGWEYVESLEDTTFYLISSLSSNLILSYPKSGVQGDSVRSRFVEATGKDSSVAFLDAPEFIPGTTTHTNTREHYENIGLCPSILPSTMSATRLRSFLQCPYRYLLQSLKVPMKSTQKNIIEGQWLHKVLECFFIGYKDKVSSLTQKENKEELIERLLTLTCELGPHNVLATSLGLHLRYHSWPRWVDHIFPRLHFKMSTEKKLEGQPVTIDKEPWSLHGSVDHIQESSDISIIYDFKRQYQPSVKEVEQGLEPQLPFYALALNTHNIQTMVTGYWSILKGSWEPRGVSQAVKHTAQVKGLVSSMTPDLQTQVTNIQKKWALRQAEVQENGYKPDIGAWCERCDYQGVCRKNDPDLSSIFEKNKRMDVHHEDTV